MESNAPRRSPLVLIAAAALAIGAWTPTSSLETARLRPTATLLGGVLATVELWEAP